ncbi:MAG TPA: ABC transporter ATP-binding protein [Clostridia bacterium]|nr:ABC transporter ATP-binding protein [Clostridia bacterium]
MDRLLEVKDLEISFNTFFGEVKAVRGVSFYLNKGESIAIVGESGCGKSVTAQAVTRLLQTPPASIKSGSISFNGVDILKLTEKQMEAYRGSEASMIFQDPMTSLNPTMKIGCQISESLMNHEHISRRKAMGKAVETLKLVGIPNPERRANQYPHEFSGGMRQRAMIAIALACNPKLLIADEPTTSLDVTIQAQILELMESLRKQLGTSIIMITHNLGVVANVAERVLVMYAGKIIESGKVSDLFHHPMHPYTVGLLNSFPKLNQKRKTRLSSIDGSPPDLFSPPEGCGFAARCKYALKLCERRDPEMQDLGNEHTSACWLTHPEMPASLKPDWMGGSINAGSL